MVNIRGYLSANFTKTFLTVFIPFFFIISLVYLVKISVLTAQIQITLPELLQLFTYYIPAIIFYALPISFIASVATVLLRLSMDNELIALFSLGLPAKKIMYPLVWIALLFSILLLVISLAAMPQTKQLYSSFKNSKKAEMTFNVIPEELGQKFGNYYIYIKDEAQGKFQDVVIYNQDKSHSDQIFSAKSGNLTKVEGVFSLLLFNGKGYTFSPENVQQIEYQKLQVYDTVHRQGSQFEDVGKYWKKSLTDTQRKRKFLFFIFVSLIPILSLYVIASFSIINPRYQKNHSFIVIGLTTVFFYMIATSLDKYGTIGWFAASVVFLLLLGLWLFHRQVSRYF